MGCKDEPNEMTGREFADAMRGNDKMSEEEAHWFFYYYLDGRASRLYNNFGETTYYYRRLSDG